jgi:DNA-binding GntR family transcriptional regulator
VVVKVPDRTRGTDTTEAIRQMIYAGEFDTATRLRDIDLAEKLGVSRATIRESMRPLIEDGIVIYEPFKGNRVAEFADEDLRSLAKVRVALETLAATELARQMNREIRAALQLTIGHMNSCEQAGDPEGLYNAHLAFHRAIYNLAGLPLLGRMWRVVEAQTRLALRIDQDVRPDYRRIVHEHKVVLEMIDSADADAMTRVLTAHILDSAEDIIRKRPQLKSATAEAEAEFASTEERVRS